MYEKILVPLDGSPFSELALPHAEAIAQHFKGEILLVRICQPVAVPFDLYALGPDVTDSYRQELQTQAEQEGGLFEPYSKEIAPEKH